MKSITMLILVIILDMMIGHSLECPEGSDQIGIANADIGGCGLEQCDERYGKTSIEECAAHCEANINCKSYTWAPLNGDRNHNGVTVCTIYDDDTPNQMWSPQQIMCGRPRLQCAEGSEQIAGINADIGGCGLEACDARYSKQTIEECAAYCKSMTDCNAYSWAPMDGDRNHPGVAVCTVYGHDNPNQIWSPLQILCTKPEETMCCSGKGQWGQICGAMDNKRDCKKIYSKKGKRKCSYSTCGAAVFFEDDYDDDDEEQEMVAMSGIYGNISDVNANRNHWMYLLYALVLSVATILGIFMYKWCKHTKGGDETSALLTNNSV